MTRLLRLAGLAVLVAVMLAATVATLNQPFINGPRHVCRGYVEVKPKHPNSDLYGGAITTWEPHCWLVRSR